MFEPSLEIHFWYLYSQNPNKNATVLEKDIRVSDALISLWIVITIQEWLHIMSLNIDNCYAGSVLFFSDFLPTESWSIHVPH